MRTRVSRRAKKEEVETGRGTWGRSRPTPAQTCSVQVVHRWRLFLMITTITDCIVATPTDSLLNIFRANQETLTEDRESNAKFGVRLWSLQTLDRIHSSRKFHSRASFCTLWKWRVREWVRECHKTTLKSSQNPVSLALSPDRRTNEKTSVFAPI